MRLKVSRCKPRCYSIKAVVWILFLVATFVEISIFSFTSYDFSLRRVKDVEVFNRGRFITSFEEKVREVSQGRLSQDEFIDWITAEAGKYPVFTKGIVAEAMDSLQPDLRQFAQDLVENVIQKASESKKVVRVIPVGPAGSRSFPFSTQGPFGTPKPFTLSPYGRKVIELAIQRALLGQSPENIYFVTTQDIAERVQQVARENGIPVENVLVEPMRANTAAAFAYLVMELKERGFSDDTVISLMTTDHDIPDDDALQAAFDSAETEAYLEPVISLLGIIPTEPDVNMGYIAPDNQRSFFKEAGFNDVMGVERFREKPRTADVAQSYINAGSFWNSGKFIFKMSTVLKAFKQYAPELYRLLDSAVSKGEISLEEAYRQIIEKGLNKQFEKTVVERMDAIAVTAYPGRWADLGNLHCRYMIEVGDQNDNVIRFDNGKVTLVDSSGNNVLLAPRDGETVLHIFGLHNMNVAYNNQNKTLVIVPKDKDNNVKNLVQLIERTPGLQKYLILDSEVVTPTPRSGIETPEYPGNAVFLDGSGDVLLRASEGNVVYVKDGFVAVSDTYGVTVIKNGDEIYIYGPEYAPQAQAKLEEILSPIVQRAEDILDEFKEHLADNTLTPEDAGLLAQESADIFINYYLATKKILREPIELLGILATLDDVNLAKKATGPMFATVVETLNDSFDEQNRLAYYKVFAQIIDIARHRNVRLDEMLKEFGIFSEQDLVSRAMEIRQARKFEGDPNKVDRVFIHSRVTFGADVLLTSMAIQKAREVFPNAQIELIGNAKASNLFGSLSEEIIPSGPNAGKPRFILSSVTYPRRGPLMELSLIHI